MNYCFICGRYTYTERHHIFGGAYRKKSDKYGLAVNLCHYCHNEPPNGVHHNAANMLWLKQTGQRRMMEQGWTVERFREEFGKNYLEDI